MRGCDPIRVWNTRLSTNKQTNKQALVPVDISPETQLYVKTISVAIALVCVLSTHSGVQYYSGPSPIVVDAFQDPPHLGKIGK